MASKKVVLTAAITGAVHIPSMSPYLPITPEQIIDEAVAANQAGAAVVHLHTRDPKTGQPTGSPELMKEVVDGIREKFGLRPEEIAMCGDRIYTDVRTAQNAGGLGVLVLSGETTLETAVSSDPQPDITVSDIGEFGKLLLKARKIKGF